MTVTFSNSMTPPQPPNADCPICKQRIYEEWVIVVDPPTNGTRFHPRCLDAKAV